MHVWCWSMCALMWVGVFPCVCPHGGQKSTSGAFHFCSPPYLLRRASSVNWKLSVSARLAEYYAPGIFLWLPHPIPHTRIAGTHRHAQILSGHWNPSSSPHTGAVSTKHFTPWATFPTLDIRFSETNLLTGYHIVWVPIMTRGRGMLLSWPEALT